MSDSLWPMDCSLPGSSVHGILQARILEWVAIPFSRGSSQPRNWSQVSFIAGRFFIVRATREAPQTHTYHTYINTHIHTYTVHTHTHTHFPDGSVVKNPPASGRDVGSIPELGRSPGLGNGNLLQYSCLENPMERGAWWATVHGVAESWTQLSD